MYSRSYEQLGYIMKPDGLLFAFQPRLNCWTNAGNFSRAILYGNNYPTPRSKRFNTMW